MIAKEEILEAFNFRHACKLFDTEKRISDEDIHFILETARLSPSSFGFEPWHFVVVQNKELREKLKDNAWGATAKLDTASHFILGLTMKSPLIIQSEDTTNIPGRIYTGYKLSALQKFKRFFLKCRRFGRRIDVFKLYGMKIF